MGSILYSLLYADDVVLLAENESDLQEMINAVDDYCRRWALTVNLSKSKVMVVRPQAGALDDDDESTDDEDTDTHATGRTARDARLTQTSMHRRDLFGAAHRSSHLIQVFRCLANRQTGLEQAPRPSEEKGHGQNWGPCVTLE